MNSLRIIISFGLHRCDRAAECDGQTHGASTIAKTREALDAVARMRDSKETAICTTYLCLEVSKNYNRTQDDVKTYQKRITIVYYHTTLKAPFLVRST